MEALSAIFADEFRRDQGCCEVRTVLLAASPPGATYRMPRACHHDHELHSPNFFQHNTLCWLHVLRGLRLPWPIHPAKNRALR